MPSATNHVQASDLSTPPPTPPATSKAQVLSNVYLLATAFATCVEAFNQTHPHKDSDQAQKIALTKLGIQQGRLLIFGDAVGISAPPATIARHMVPSHPGLTNPDPTLPVNFGVRNPRLDEEDVRKKVTSALEEIYGRPAHLSRDELMARYGLKQPKRFSTIEHPALDTNRLEAFREKFALLNDLIHQSGIRPLNQVRRGSITMNHWTIKDVVRFDAFVKTVRIEVDSLITLMGVKEQVDKGMRTDIKAMAWHPDLRSMIVRQDWEKLKLIREAVALDYPEYVEVADKALQYLVEELRGTKIHMLQAAQGVKPSVSVDERRASGEENGGVKASEQRLKVGPQKQKRPGFWSRISVYKSKSNKHRSQSVVSAPEDIDPQRSLSDGGAPRTSEEINALEPVRSKSLSAVPDDQTPFDLNSRLASLSMHNGQDGQNGDAPNATLETVFHEEPGAGKTHANMQATLTQIPTRSTAEIDDDVDPLDNRYNLVHADTANSLIARHDMYKGVGRIDTRDIRDKSHEAAGW